MVVTTVALKDLVLRFYLRVSKDKSRRERSPDEQDKHLVGDTNEYGWGVHPDRYRDIGSASKHARKKRDDFGQLLADLTNDTFGANVLGLWEGSRGSRKMEEWVHLLSLLELRGVLVWIHVKKRLFDPRNPHDRADLLTAAIKDELYSAEVSDRATRASAANVEAGRPHGKLQYGFKRIYDAETRELIEQIHDPEKAPIVAELFERLKAKWSINRIRNDWIAREIFNGKGKPFAHKQIRAMALSPAYAGLRERTNPDGSITYVEGIWEGIVSVADFIEVKGNLEDPARRTQHDSRARHLLSVSSAAACGVCLGPLQSFNDQRRGTPRYKCKLRGHVMVSRGELDEFAEDAILGWLADPKAYEPAFADRPDDEQAEVQRVRDDLAKAKAEWKDLIRRGKLREVSSAYVAEVEPALLEEIKDLEAKRDELSAPRKLVNLIKPGHGVRVRWENTPPEARREIARVVLSPEYLGPLRLMRSPKPRAKGFPIHERVRFGDEDSPA